LTRQLPNKAMHLTALRAAADAERYPYFVILKIYCEHNSLTGAIKRLRHEGSVEVLHFPYDPGSDFRLTSRHALPSGAQWRDLGCTWAEAGDARWCDFEGSDHLDAIIAIVGPSNRRDALHVDPAYKSGCDCIVTADSDIWSKGRELETLLGLRVFRCNDPELEVFLAAAPADNDADGPAFGRPLIGKALDR